MRRVGGEGRVEVVNVKLDQGGSWPSNRSQYIHSTYPGRLCIRLDKFIHYILCDYFFPKKDIKLFCPAAFALPFFLSPPVAVAVAVAALGGFFFPFGTSLSSSSEKDS